jgi:hypothetical protein
LAISPLISYAQPIIKLPGTITSKSQQYTPVASPGQTWVLVNTVNPVVCYEEETGKQMILQLENSIDYRKQVDLYKQGNIELEKQNTLLKESNKLQNEQLDVSKRTIESYKELLKVQKDAYEEQIKNTKPSIWSKIGAALGVIGIGVLVGLLL